MHAVNDASVPTDREQQKDKSRMDWIGHGTVDVDGDGNGQMVRLAGDGILISLSLYSIWNKGITITEHCVQFTNSQRVRGGFLGFG